MLALLSAGAHPPASALAALTLRSQLNCYKYLIQKYYGKKVARMEVICCHADNGDETFFYRVPEMPAVVDYLMAHQRKACAEAIMDRQRRAVERDPTAFPPFPSQTSTWGV